MHQPKHIYLAGIITGILCGLLASLVVYETMSYITEQVRQNSFVSTWPIITPLYILGGGVIGFIISVIVHQITKQK